METAEILQSELTGKLAEPSGWVRVSVSSVIAQALITPSLPSLYERHPQLHLDILADDRVVDMAREVAETMLVEHPALAEKHLQRWLGSREELLKS